MTLELAKHLSGSILDGLKMHPQLASWIQKDHPFSIGTDDPGVFHDWNSPCATFPNAITPIACRQGADDAQDASAWSSLLQNQITLFFNPIVGRRSDIHGRRNFFALMTFLYTLGPIALVMIQTIPGMNPLYFYLVSFLSLSFAVISDSVPVEYRTPSFGVVLAGFYGGFALSPFLAIPMGHLQVSILSSVLAGASFVYVLLCFPETLPEAVRSRNQEMAREERTGREGTQRLGKIRHALIRPFRLSGNVHPQSRYCNLPRRHRQLFQQYGVFDRSYLGYLLHGGLP